VLDAAIDIHKSSLAYGKHVAVELTEENNRQLFIPKGFPRFRCVKRHRYIPIQM